MSFQVDAYLGDIKNWHKTSKKVYEIWCCKPPLGTKIHNKLEGTDYVVSDNTQFVLSGFAGEQWVIKGDKLAAGYTLLDGSEINASSVKFDKNNCWDWHKVRARSSTNVVCACFLPQNRYTNFPVVHSYGTLIANNPAVGHGLGDFLVAPVVSGNPNIQEAWVVNGLIFALTYDLRGIPKESISSAAKQVEENGAPQPATLLTGSKIVPTKAPILSEAEKDALLTNNLVIYHEAKEAAEASMKEDPRIAILFPYEPTWNNPVVFMVGVKSANTDPIDASRRFVTASIYAKPAKVSVVQRTNNGKTASEPVDLSLENSQTGKVAVRRVFNEYRVLEHLAMKKMQKIIVGGVEKEIAKYVAIGEGVPVVEKREVRNISAEQVIKNSIANATTERNLNFGKNLYSEFFKPMGFEFTSPEDENAQGEYRFDIKGTAHFGGFINVSIKDFVKRILTLSPCYALEGCDDVGELSPIDISLASGNSSLRNYLTGYLHSMTVMEGSRFGNTADVMEKFYQLSETLDNLPLIGLALGRLSEFAKGQGITFESGLTDMSVGLSISVCLTRAESEGATWWHELYLAVYDDYVEYEVNPNVGLGSPELLKTDEGSIHWSSVGELRRALDEIVIKHSTLLVPSGGLTPATIF